MSKLAIVIPAYKAKYLEKALHSISLQTNKDFTVYIGDDNSKEGLENICSLFTGKLNFKYHRFESNLGGIDLVAQWNRCCELINDEEWVWLFSDDDLVEATCVEVFHETLRKTEAYYDVYRFDTITIDQHDNILGVSPENPEIEDHINLTYHLLKWERGNSMPDHIFRVSRLKEIGGFINFPFAQASDFASSIKFANSKGLYTMRGPKVRWRFSGDNISSQASKLKEKAIFGHLDFIEWLDKELHILELEKQKDPSNKLSKQLLIDNLTYVIKNHYKGIPTSKFFEVAKRVSEIFKWNYLHALYFCLKANRIASGKRSLIFRIISKIKSVLGYRLAGR